MKYSLVGNGINIQSGGLEYSNEQIIIRAVKKIKSPDLNQEVNGIEILQLFELIFQDLKKNI